MTDHLLRNVKTRKVLEIWVSIHKAFVWKALSIAGTGADNPEKISKTMQKARHCKALEQTPFNVQILYHFSSSTMCVKDNQVCWKTGLVD